MTIIKNERGICCYCELLCIRNNFEGHTRLIIHSNSISMIPTIFEFSNIVSSIATQMMLTSLFQKSTRIVILKCNIKIRFLILWFFKTRILQYDHVHVITIIWYNSLLVTKSLFFLWQKMFVQVWQNNIRLGNKNLRRKQLISPS